MGNYGDLYDLEHGNNRPAATPPPAAPLTSTPDRTKGNTKPARKPANQEPGKLANVSTAETFPDQPTGAGFDINAERDAKGTFEMTQAEYTALFNLKRPLGFKFGTRITLHDIVRCAINLALEDYRAKGDGSFLITHLSQKKAK